MMRGVTGSALPPETLAALASLSGDRPLVVFDLETTGADRLTDRIVEIAALRFGPAGEVATFESRVNPGVRIPRESTRIHGISDADVAGAPAFLEIAGRVLEFFADADLAGYNVRAFDVPVLLREFELANVVFPIENRRIVDMQTIYFKKEPRDLAAAVRFFAGREHTSAHSALADVDRVGGGPRRTVPALRGPAARHRSLARALPAAGGPIRRSRQALSLEGRGDRPGVQRAPGQDARGSRRKASGIPGLDDLQDVFGGSKADRPRRAPRHLSEETMSTRQALPRGLARRRSRPVRIALLTLGWSLLTLGIIGGLLPVIQGWPFGVAGAAILYVESRWVQRKVRRFRQRNPKFERTWLKARAWLKSRRRARKAKAVQSI